VNLRHEIVCLVAGLLALPYRLRLARLGRAPRIRPPLRLAGARRIRIGDEAWIDSHATLAAGARGGIEIGRRVEIRSHSCLEADDGRISLGDRCSVNSFCLLNGFGGLEIGDDVRIASHVVILSSRQRDEDSAMTIHSQGVEGLKTIIGSDVWIGAHAVIRGGVTVGAHSIVGAGAVVTRDVPPFAVVAGVPARVIRMRDRK
jgi:acetyltransferase-like isoleucine patch superfamily enzyme